LKILGAELEPLRNDRATGDAPACISRRGAPVQLWVIPADEESQIARELYPLLHDPHPGESP
jgi:acetate kinase